MVDVPAARPVTLPDPSTEALVLLVLHVPPGVGSDKEVTRPAQTVAVPVIAGTISIGFLVATTFWLLVHTPFDAVAVNVYVPSDDGNAYTVSVAAPA